MGLLDAAFAPLRAVLGTAEHSAEREFESVLPVKEIEQIQGRVLETAEAIRSATETIEAHVEVIETLATSVPPLTIAVEALTVELVELTKILGPIAAVERDASAVEHELGRVGHLFSRHRPEDAVPPAGEDTTSS